MTALEPHRGLVMMTAPEARECADAIKGDLGSARRRLLDLYEREGWRALGYESWRACAMAEFRQSQATLYRQLRAAEVERSLSQVEKTSLPSEQARELARLPDAESQREVWAEVGGPEATAAKVREAVARHPSAPAPKPRPPVRAVPVADDFPEDDGTTQVQCDRGHWYPVDDGECSRCGVQVEPAPAPLVVPPVVEPEPFILPPATLSPEGKAFYQLVQCVHVMNYDPAAVAATGKPDALAAHIHHLGELAAWLPQLVDALRARQGKPDLRAVK